MNLADRGLGVVIADIRRDIERIDGIITQLAGIRGESRRAFNRIEIIQQVLEIVIETTEDTLSGVVDGSNKVFLLTYAPKPGTLQVFFGAGFTVRYSISGLEGREITLDNAPSAGNVISVVYQKR